MNKKPQQKGQALVIIALAAVGLFAFSALAIDGTMVFSDKRHAQNAADTAAMAAALAWIRSEGADFIPAGLNRAASNGYDNDGSSNIVEVNWPPRSGQYIDNREYIQVIITSHVNMTFARVIGRTQMTNVVEAVARVQGSFSSPLYNGNALVALKKSGCGICGNGNPYLDIINSGAFSNSTSVCSMNFVGNGDLAVGAGFAFTIAPGGTVCETGNINLNGPVKEGVQGPTNLIIPPPTFTCTGTGSVTGNTINPGTFTSSLDLIGNTDYEFASDGNYCFDNGATINGNINLTANNINIRINGGSFQINGNSTFTCTNMLVYGAGGSGMHFNGNGSNTCTGVTFYMASGSVTWNGNVANTFTAPTDETDYKGLLIYMPHGNTSGLTINGNAGNKLTGSIIAIQSTITINGNSGTKGLETQIIGYDIALSGNSNTTINYNAADQFIPPAAPTIELAE